MSLPVRVIKIARNGKRGGSSARRAWLSALSLSSLLFITTLAGAGERAWEFRPGFYGTWGSYTNVATSRDCSGFLSAAHAGMHVLSAAYSDLRIEQEKWSYRQRLWIAGGLGWRGRWNGRFYYGHIQGDFRARDTNYRYRDLSDLYSGEIGYGNRRWSFGYTATYETGIGALTQKVHQHTARFSWSSDPRILFTIRPNYTWVLDGRRLKSVQFSVSQNVAREVVLKCGGMIGKRAYYFDNDLLTIYNQNETQLGTAFVQWEVSPVRNWTVVTEYILTPFEGYDIQYLVVGIKGRIR